MKKSPVLLFITVFLIVHGVYAKADVPVFILAGQSNMSGYAASSGLTADQSTTVEMVKIYVDMTWENNGKLKKWLTLGPGFGSSSSTIGPELSIGRTLSEKLPDIKIALIKVCSGSTYLGNYVAKPDDCWVPPSSNNGNAGAHYKRMLSATAAAFESFNSAFDTAQYTPRLAGFVWLQGEFDGQVKSLADAYEKNLTHLINDVRNDFGIDDLPVIIPMIDVQNSWQYNATVRNAEVAVTRTMENVDTLDTRGFETDGVHYKTQGQVKIGTITAQRWLDMEYQYSPAVSIDWEGTGFSRRGHHQEIPHRNSSFFDLSGRKLLAPETIRQQSIPVTGVWVTVPDDHASPPREACRFCKEVVHRTGSFS